MVILCRRDKKIADFFNESKDLRHFKSIFEIFELNTNDCHLILKKYTLTLIVEKILKCKEKN